MLLTTTRIKGFSCRLQQLQPLQNVVFGLFQPISDGEPPSLTERRRWSPFNADSVVFFPFHHVLVFGLGFIWLLCIKIQGKTGFFLRKCSSVNQMSSSCDSEGVTIHSSLMVPSSTLLFHSSTVSTRHAGANVGISDV